MLHRRFLMLSTFFAVAMMGLGGAASASAIPAGTTLPLSGFSHMLVDPVHAHVFITGVAADSTILVRNEDGTAAGSISGESGAGGMVLDGSTLYVARCGWNTIDEIDTATLTKTGSFAAAVDGACNLAEAGGRLWYSDSTDQQWGDLWSVSLDSSHTAIDTGRTYYQALFATTSAHPDWLVVSNQLSPASVDVLDVTDPTTPAVLGSKSDAGGADFAVSPDGSTLFVPQYDRANAYALPGLTAAGAYPMGIYASAVAVSPSGGKIAVGANGIYWPDVYEFDTGNSTYTTKWDFGATGDTTRSGGLAFTSDERSLLVVTQPGAHPVLRVLPALPLGALSVSRSTTTVLYGKAATITAHLTTSTSNRVVKVYRKPVGGGSTVLVASGSVGPAGNFSVAVKPKADMTYWAVWDGDSTHSQTTSTSTRVNVRVQIHSPAQGGYKTQNGARLYHYARSCSGPSHTGCPRFLAYATPLHPGKTLSFTVQGIVNGSWRTLLTGSHAAGSNGKLRLTIYYSSRAVIGHRQRIRFSMKADADHVGNTGPWTPFEVTS
jgi:hypothetical protein